MIHKSQWFLEPMPSVVLQGMVSPRCSPFPFPYWEVVTILEVVHPYGSGEEEENMTIDRAAWAGRGGALWGLGLPLARQRTPRRIDQAAGSSRTTPALCRQTISLDLPLHGPLNANNSQHTSTPLHIYQQ